MPVRQSRLVSVLAAAVAAVAVAVLLAAAAPLVGLPSVLPWGRGRADAEEPALPPGSAVALAPGRRDTLRLPSDVVVSLRVQAVEAKKSTEPRTLHLRGKLALDANHLSRVHARFPGEVIQIEAGPDGRPLRTGDTVKPDQLLAVIWSKELGEKKSELLDALSQLRLDQSQLAGLKKYADSIPPVRLLEAERAVEADLIAADRAERTLRSWRLTDEEIAAVKKRAERVRGRGGRPSLGQDSDWARLDVRARLGGTIVERNVAVGDIVDTSLDLFKIADLSRLVVWADVYEEDLPALLATPPAERRWVVRLKADPDAPPLKGTIEQIGEVIDPNQHTALAMGLVDNPGRRLRAGQFVTATVTLPPPPDEVVLPASVLIEDGRSSIVFVQEDPARTDYTMRHVAVGRRLPGQITLKSRLTPEQERLGLKPVRPGELVVRGGVIELKQALDELQAGK